MGWHEITGIVIFLVIYALISSERINKTIAALIGASVFIAMHMIGQEEAFRVIDWHVITLLVSMMIIVGITKKTGVFQYVAIRIAKFSKGSPALILILLSLATALFSAFLDNVTTILILTPVSILIAVELGISPVPFIISQVLASNIGGTATLIGDPPNIMIGSAANLTFNDFLMNLTPAVITILILMSFFIYLIFGRKMHVTNERRARIMEFDESRTIENRPLLIKSLIVLSLVIAGFLLHDTLKLEASSIALMGASLLMLLAGKEEVDEFFHEVEWGTIFFFIGLFILVGGLVELGVIETLSKYTLRLTGNRIPETAVLILWISGVFSAFIDNIPYVATMIPLIKHIGDVLGTGVIKPLWWALALGACLGGNGTMVGASANVLAVGLARKSGYKISFWEFTKYGIAVTVIALLVSTIYVMFVYL